MDFWCESTSAQKRMWKAEIRRPSAVGPTLPRWSANEPYGEGWVVRKKLWRITVEFFQTASPGQSPGVTTHSPCNVCSGSSFGALPLEDMPAGKSLQRPRALLVWSSFDKLLAIGLTQCPHGLDGTCCCDGRCRMSSQCFQDSIGHNAQRTVWRALLVNDHKC